MEIILHLTVIVLSLYFYKRMVKIRLAKKMVKIYVYYRHWSLRCVQANDAVAFLKLTNSREKEIKEWFPWLRR